MKDDSNEFEDLSDLVDDIISMVTYGHMYTTNYNGSYKRHSCLQHGDWCWRQAAEHPIEAIKYLLKHRG